MTNPPGTEWRFLIIEDNPDTARELEEASQSFVDAPDTSKVEVCSNFSEAAPRLSFGRYDVLIVDLKDDKSDSDDLPGLELFQKLKAIRFVPVVFYTALPQYVRSEQTAVVRVVEKTEGIRKLSQEIRSVISTQLPALTRHIDEIQRSYMWDFVSTHWLEFETPQDQADLAYLLARRLASSLQKEARKMARKLAGRTLALAHPRNVHPMEMYVRPPIGPNRLAGDLLKGLVGTEIGYWVVLTPSCDFEQEGKLENVLLAQCLLLTGEVEYLEWIKNPANTAKLKCLIGDNREDMPSERFKFLPGTYFFPDSVVDFQRLRAVPAGDVMKLEAIASLDSPFAEAMLAGFSRYFGRLGTPDVDKNVVLKRLEALAASTNVELSPTSPGEFPSTSADAQPKQ